MYQSEEARICCGEKKSQWNAPEEADFSLNKGEAGVTHHSHSGVQTDGTAATLSAAGCQGSGEEKSLERLNSSEMELTRQIGPPEAQGHEVQLGSRGGELGVRGLPNDCHSPSLRSLPAQQSVVGYRVQARFQFTLCTSATSL